MTGREWLYKWGVPSPEEVNQTAYTSVYLALVATLNGQGLGADARVTPNDDVYELAEQLCGEFVGAAEEIRKIIGNARYKEAQAQGLDATS